MTPITSEKMEKVKKECYSMCGLLALDADEHSNSVEGSVPQMGEFFDQILGIPKPAICPTCRQNTGIKEYGEWQCPRCNNYFSYYIQERVVQSQALSLVNTKCPSCLNLFSIPVKGVWHCPYCNYAFEFNPLASLIGGVVEYGLGMLGGFIKNKFSNKDAQEDSKPVNNIDAYYSILECTPHSSVEEVKRAYRRLAADYHPDKIVHKDLPPGFIQFAEKKFNEITEAYEQIMAVRVQR